MDGKINEWLVSSLTGLDWTKHEDMLLLYVVKLLNSNKPVKQDTADNSLAVRVLWVSLFNKFKSFYHRSYPGYETQTLKRKSDKRMKLLNPNKPVSHTVDEPYIDASPYHGECPLSKSVQSIQKQLWIQTNKSVIQDPSRTVIHFPLPLRKCSQSF